MILSCTGHRPDKLGGYGISHPITQFVERWMIDMLEKLRPDSAISGMAQGADQIFAKCCMGLGIPFIAAVPLRSQSAPWSPEAQSEYIWILERAKDVVVVSDDDAPWFEAMQERNEYMVDNCDRMLVVWNGSPGGTANCVKYAKKVKRKLDLMSWNDLKRWAIDLDLGRQSPICTHDNDPVSCPCELSWT